MKKFVMAIAVIGAMAGASVALAQATCNPQVQQCR